jgi:DNA repair photolyase
VNSKTVKASSFMTKTKLGGNDFTCNPYIGCTHGCVYCYAKTIERNHPQSSWGEYVDIKQYPNTSIPKGTGSKSLFFSSMTDCYQPIEKVTESTKKILESIQDSVLHISILTKSDLILRDIEVLKKIMYLEVGFSISLSDKDASIFEKGATLPSNRIKALKALKTAGISTHVFISPIIPFITNPFKIIDEVKNHVDYVMFDTLNLSNDENKARFYEILKLYYPEQFTKIIHVMNHVDILYYKKLKKDIESYCDLNHLLIKYIYR